MTTERPRGKGTRTPENKVKMPAELQKHNGVITRSYGKSPAVMLKRVEEINNGRS